MTSPPLRFGDFELDPSAFQLRRAGHRIRLERKPLELLILLAERHGQLVTREEIIERVWGKDFSFDAERGVNNAVRKIRSALNDESEQPHFVETVVGKGYTFIARTELVHEPAGPVTPAPAVSPVPRHPFRWRRAWISVVVVAALFVIGVAFDTGGIRRRIFPPAVPPVRSLAVLPLENLSGDPAQDYLADGMTDALITDLAQISSLRVISRTSAMHYKGSHQALPEIARELNVDAVVEGSVIRSGDRVRIMVQLLEARTDRHLWAQAYDRDMREIMSLQRDAADSIAHEIRAKLTPRENVRFEQIRKVDPEAYDDYLRGWYFWNKFTEPGMRRAVEYFEASVRKDPSFALGYAGLANAYHELHFSARPKDIMPKAREAAEKALQLDDTVAEAHAALGWVKWVYEWDWPGAEREFQRAIQLNPGHAISHGMYANFLDSRGRFDEASREFQVARQIDPVALVLVSNAADHFRTIRQYDKAIAENRAALDLDPSFAGAHNSLVLVYRAKGMEKECIAELEQAAMGDGETELAEKVKTASQHGGYKNALKAWLKYYQDKRSAGSYVLFSDEAWVDTALGNKELALQALEKAFTERESDMVSLNVEPEWDLLRADPRFQDLVRRVGPAASIGAGVAAH
jgi:TolB-like protein/DNA-binding winged helix-turn-helix (wHTH) protein